MSAHPRCWVECCYDVLLTTLRRPRIRLSFTAHVVTAHVRREKIHRCYAMIHPRCVTSRRRCCGC